MELGKLPEQSTFNYEAAKENMRNKKNVKLTEGAEGTRLLIDSKLVTFKGIPAELLSYGEKKKLENLILFMFLPELKKMPVIRYT